MEDLREEFKTETGLRTIVEDGMGNSFYTEDYVEWLEDRVKKLSISDINHSILNRDLSKEICFFRVQKDAMVDQAVVLFKDKLNDDDLLLLKKSFELTWNGGFRWAKYDETNRQSDVIFL